MDPAHAYSAVCTRSGPLSRTFRTKPRTRHSEHPRPARVRAQRYPKASQADSQNVVVVTTDDDVLDVPDDGPPVDQIQVVVNDTSDSPADNSDSVRVRKPSVGASTTVVDSSGIPFGDAEQCHCALCIMIVNWTRPFCGRQ